MDTNHQSQFSAAISQHAGMVLATARRLSPANAEDVTQAVFLLLRQKRNRLLTGQDLAGWLYRTTRYCALNANKLQRRRMHHEQEATMLRPETTKALDDSLRQTLDDAIARLPGRSRQVFILRYLEGLTAHETAGRLGLTASAAAKQGERALEKLRQMLMAQRPELQTAGLVALLGHESLIQIPSALARSLTAQIATPGASAIAAAVGKSAAVAKVKLLTAASVVAALSAATLVAILPAKTSAPRPAIAAALPAPAKAALPPTDEASVPGSPHIYRYEILLEDALCNAILADAQKLPADGDWSAYRISSDKLRKWLVNAPKERALLSYEHGPNLAKAADAPTTQNGRYENFYAAGPSLMLERRTSMLQIIPRFNINGIIWADASGVHFPLRNNNNWKIEVSGEPGRQIERSGSFSMDAMLKPGDTLLLTLPADTLGGLQRTFVVAMEVFSATDLQAAWLRDLRQTDRWMQFGPSLCRTIADEASRLAKLGHRAEEVPAEWKKTLSDGTVIKLQTIAYPGRWPGIAWDGQGIPVVGYTDWSSSEANKVWIRGMVEPTTYPKSMNANGRLFGQLNVDKPHDWMLYVTPAEPSTCSIRVGTGPFTNSGTMVKGKPIQVGSLTVTPRYITQSADEWGISYVVEGQAKDRALTAIVPVVITKTGQEVGPEHCGAEHEWCPDYAKDRTTREDRSDGFVRRAAGDFHQSEFDHIELLWRKSELVTFAGFKTAPVEPVKFDVQKILAERDVRAKAKELPVATVPDIRTEDDFPEAERPRTAIIKLRAAIAKGDTKAIREGVCGDAEVCDRFVELMMLYARMRTAIQQRLPNAALKSEFREMLAWDKDLLPSAPFEIREDRIATSDRVVCRFNAGQWQVDLDKSLDGMFSSPREQEIISTFAGFVTKLTDDLNAGAITTSDQLNAAFDGAVQAVRKQAR